MVQRGGSEGEGFGDADWLLGQLGEGEADASAEPDPQGRRRRAADEPEQPAGGDRPAGAERPAGGDRPAEAAESGATGRSAEPAREPGGAAPGAPTTHPVGTPAEPVGTDASAPRTPWWTNRTRGRRAAEPEGAAADAGGTGTIPAASASAAASAAASASSDAERGEQSGRRRADSSGEESLDWFSLAAQPPQQLPGPDSAPEQSAPGAGAGGTANDAAAPMTTPSVPVTDEPRSERGDTGVLDEPLRRRRDRGPAAPPADPILTAVEPPVAPQRASQAPTAPQAPAGTPAPGVPSTAAEPWAPAAPAAPQTPAAAPVPGAPSAEPRPPIVPGPATPTAPFALTWGDPAAPAVPGEPAAPAVPGAAAAPGASAPDAAPAGSDAARAAEAARTAEAPDTGAFGEPLVPPPVSAAAASASASATTDFDAALWSALQEGETGEAPIIGQHGTGSASDAAQPDSPAASRTPFPAFASGTETPAEPAADAPVDDLLAGLAIGGAAAGGAASGRPESDPLVESSDPAGPAAAELDPLGLGFGDDAAAEAQPGDARDGATAPDSAAAHEAGDLAGADDADAELDAESADTADEDLAASGFVWGLVPDPNAEDPRAEAGPLGTVALAAAAAGDDEEPSALEPEPVDLPEADSEADADAALAAEAEAAADAAADADALQPTAFHDEPLAATPAEPEFPFLDASASEPESTPGTQPEPLAPTALVPTVTAGATAATAAGAARPGGRPSADGSATHGPTTDGSTGGGIGGGRGGSRDADGGAARRRRTLLWIAGGLVAVLVLAGLFFLGTKLPFGGAPAASTPATSESARPSDTPAPAPTAAQPAGVHAWNTLFGGECLDPFADAWAEDYTVVDCAAPHAAQLVLRGTLPGEAGAAFPGDAELAAQLGTACQADGVLDQNAIAGLTDLQLVFSYPVAEQWDAGERTFYCFANRSSGEPLTASIAGATPSQVAAG